MQSAQMLPVKQMLPSVRRLTKFIALLALVVGPLLFFFPGRTDRLFAWTINPPLTAAFLGANYATALVIEVLAFTERIWARARVAFAGMFVFTTLTTLATLIHRDKFHFHSSGMALATTWAWFIIYIAVIPLMVWVIVAQVRVRGADPPPGPAMPVWLRALLGIQVLCMLALGSALFIAPQSAIRLWPWPLTLLTGRAVGAWLLGLGVAAGHGALERTWDRSRIAHAGNLAAGGLQLIVLARFTGAIDWTKPGGWIYLGFLVAMLGLGAYGLAMGRRAAPRTAETGRGTEPSVAGTTDLIPG